MPPPVLQAAVKSARQATTAPSSRLFNRASFRRRARRLVWNTKDDPENRLRPDYCRKCVTPLSACDLEASKRALGRASER
jgi:hypothetical protein